MDRGAHRGAVGLRVVVPLQRRREDGRRGRGPPPTGPSHVDVLHGRVHQHHQVRDGHPDRAAAQPGRRREADRHPRPHVGWQGAPGHRGRVDEGGVRRHRCALPRSGSAHRRVRCRHAGAVDGRTAHVPRRVRRLRRRLLPAPACPGFGADHRRGRHRVRRPTRWRSPHPCPTTPPSWRHWPLVG